MRRMGRPGLVGMAARTAVVAGTATAVSGNVARRQAGKQQASAQGQAADVQYAAEQQQAQVDAAVQEALAAQAAQQAAAQQAQEIAALQAQLAAQQAPPAASAPAPAGGVDVVAELQKLAELKNAGILDDAEFAAAKAKLLG